MASAGPTKAHRARPCTVGPAQVTPVAPRKPSSRRLADAEAAFIVRGGKPGDYHVIAPWCVTPVGITLKADRKQLPTHGWYRKPDGSIYHYDRHRDLSLMVACRKCEGCLKHKRTLWQSRAYHETICAPRTWFGTLTFNPRLHAEALAEAMSTVWADGIDYQGLTESQQLAANAEVLYPSVDRFWKRLRKAGYRFRYLCVHEAHETGLVHFHVLVHEMTPDQLPKAVLEEQWVCGHSHWRLVKTGEKRAVFYVCKYLAKDEATRPRASLHYGKALNLSQKRRDLPTAKEEKCDGEAAQGKTKETIRNERKEVLS